MSERSISVSVTFGYSNTTKTRTYVINDVSETDLESVKSKVMAINASISGGTDDGMKEFFRSDDYDATDPNHIVGEFSGIVAAKSEITEETVIM